METEKMKLFLQLQCCTLVLFLSMLPEFDVVQMFTGVDMNIANVICRWLGMIGVGFILFKLYTFYTKEGTPLPNVLLITVGGGLLLSLVAVFTAQWLEYVALIALGVGLFLSPKYLEIDFINPSIKGAYLILLAVILHAYTGINDSIAVSIAGLTGLIIYIIALGKLKTSLDINGITGADKLKTAAILGIVAIILSIIPLISIIGGILAIVAFFLEFMGYGWFMKSDSVGIEGQEGAKKLRWSMIILLVAAIFGIIPFIGSKIEGILTLISFIFIYQGWNNMIFGIYNKSNRAIENIESVESIIIEDNIEAIDSTDN